MTENVSPEMVERMVALVRALENTEVGDPISIEVCEGARNIAAELPAPVDPDEQAAAELVTEHGWIGVHPSSNIALVVKAAIKRGRTLETTERIAALRIARETEQGAPR